MKTLSKVVCFPK